MSSRSALLRLGGSYLFNRLLMNNLISALVTRWATAITMVRGAPVVCVMITLFIESDVHKSSDIIWALLLFQSRVSLMNR